MTYINTSGIGKARNCMETQRPKTKGRVFSYNSSFPTSVDIHVTIYQYGKIVLYFFTI